MEKTEGFVRAFDGVELFTRRWTPSGPTKATVCLVHGLGEHSGRYDHVAAHLGDAGYALSSFDLRGNGRTQGKRGDVRFQPALEDIDALLERERAEAEGRPVFLYGHSFGGLLVLAYVLDRKPSLPGVVVSAPVLHTAVREQPAKLLATRLLGGVLPSVTIPIGLDETMISRDPEVVEAYRTDPLVHGMVSIGSGLDSLRTIERIFRDAGEFPAPLFLLHGDDDQINYLSGSREFASRMGEGCTLRVYEGLFHEPHNEPESKQVLDDVVSWLDERL